LGDQATIFTRNLECFSKVLILFDLAHFARDFYGSKNHDSVIRHIVVQDADWGSAEDLPVVLHGRFVEIFEPWFDNIVSFRLLELFKLLGP
jgi:hypothetical protein